MPRRVVALLGPVLALAAGCATDPADTGVAEDEVRVCAAGPTTAGIDVSVYQGTIDWPRVKAAGIQFAIVRVSDGLHSIDSKFAANWAGTKNAGVLRGAYQFFEPAQDPVAQADLLISKMGTLGPDDLPPVIDVEATGGLAPAAVAAKVRAWLARVQAVTGRVPIIYSGKYFWNDNVGRADMTQYPLWIPQYGPVCPDLPDPWTDWAFFQNSSTGAIAGIAGNVDTDKFNGDRAALLAFAHASAVSCGDGTCGLSESHDSCAVDCPPCGVIAADGGVVDDGDDCFDGGGNPAYLRAVDGAGFEGDLVWTHTTSDASEANFGEWTLELAEAGSYRIEVYTPAAYARSKAATYKVRHAGVVDTFTIDQTAVDGWQPLGDLQLAAGGHQSIHVGDNTGEPLAGNVQLVFDAVRLTRLDGAVVPDPDPTPDPEPDPAADPDAATGGCAAGGGGGGAGLAASLGLLGLALVRRRR